MKNKRKRGHENHALAIGQHHMRSTTFTDKKKEQSKKACRGK